MAGPRTPGGASDGGQDGNARVPSRAYLALNLTIPNDPACCVADLPVGRREQPASGNSGALFLAAATQNLFCLKLAEEIGIKIGNPWIPWFKVASLPAIISLLATPYLLYKIFPPEIKDTPHGPTLVAQKLDNMGSVTRNEWVMVGTMVLAVSLWIFGDAIGVSSVVAAMIGHSILLLLGVLNWDGCLNEKLA